MVALNLKDIYFKVIANINIKNRPDNLIDIGDNIKWLIEQVGDKKKVAKELGISVGMLNKFLSVFKSFQRNSNPN